MVPAASASHLFRQQTDRRTNHQLHFTRNGLTPTRFFWKRVLEEETQHFLGGVRSSRISVGSRLTASRPRVSSSVDVPVLKNCPPTRVGLNRAGIGVPS